VNISAMDGLPPSPWLQPALRQGAKQVTRMVLSGPRISRPQAGVGLLRPTYHTRFSFDEPAKSFAGHQVRFYINCEWEIGRASWTLLEMENGLE